MNNVQFVYLSWIPSIANEGARGPTPFHFLWRHDTSLVLLGGVSMIIGLVLAFGRTQ